jgi:N-acetylneuraminic acid mutarotase
MKTKTTKFQFPGTPRSSFGHIVDNGKLYVVGGHLGGFHNYPGAAFSVECHRVDLSSGNVEPCESYPHGVQGQRLAAYNGRIYSFGGFRFDAALDYSFLDQPPSPQNPTGQYDSMNFFARSASDIFSLDTTTKKWTIAGELPRRRSSNVAGIVGTTVYLVGGWDGTPRTPRDHAGAFHRIVDQFSLASGACVPSRIRLRDPVRRAFTATIHHDCVIMAGGISPADAQAAEGDYLNNVTSYDPKTKAWRDLPALEFDEYPRATGWFSLGICSLPDCLVVFGGLGNSYDLNGNVYVLKDGASKWVKNSKSPTRGAMFPELIWLGDRDVLVFGGHNLDETGDFKKSLPLGMAEVISIDQ